MAKDAEGNSKTTPPIPDSETTPPKFEGLVEVKEETDEQLLKKLQPMADKHNAALLAFIAPLRAVRISPVRWVNAEIRIWEELGIERAVFEIQEKFKVRKLFLLIESPGGIVSSSYLIANFLRKNFSEIITFIPHEALSGGSLIAMASNKIVMGEMARLSPIDMQVPYKNTRVSVNRMASALARLEEFFETKLPEEVPFPKRALVEKLDPIIYDVWATKTYEMALYATEILKRSGYNDKDISVIRRHFVYSSFSHNLVIHRERAKSYKLKVTNKDELVDELNSMRWWLKHYLMQPGADHYIRYVTVKQKTRNQTKAGSESET